MPDKKSFQAALDLIKNDQSKILGLNVGAHKVTPGMKIPKAEAQNPPELSFKIGSGTYLVVALDIDAPFPSFDVLGPILHWIQPDLKPEPGADESFKLVTTSPFVANYIGPAPPPGSSPHRYVFMLYDQPEGFDAKKYAPADGKKLGNAARMWYDLGAFEKKINLGPVIACNYFVSN